MGRFLEHAIERAGLSELFDSALGGTGLPTADVARLREQDMLLVAGMADAVRAKARGDEVRVMTPETARGAADLERVELPYAASDGPTGQELLLEVAFRRLATPARRAIAVSFDQIGLELAQTALLFGADTLIGDLASKRTLPLLEGPAARRQELAGLCARAGRTVRFVETSELLLEQRS